MENSFNNRDFERFVKQNADQYRMFPSEKVWKNIHHSLHTRRRWYSIGFALLLLTTGAVTWVMLNHDKRAEITSVPVVAKNISSAKQEQPAPQILVKTNKPSKNADRFITPDQNLNARVFPDLSASSAPDFTEDASSIASIEKPLEVPSVNVQPVNITKSNPVAVRQPVSNRPANTTKNNVVKNDLPVVAETKVTEPVATEQTKSDLIRPEYPMTIESVVNAFSHRRKKLTWEVYFSPTISYRKLGENKDFIKAADATNNSLSYYTAIADINSLVTHKPDIGLQLGFSAGYPLSKSLKIIAGMQFNVSKYDILAYTYSSEVATIALNTGTGSNSAVSSFTNYRNFNGDDAGWLHNLYFSASLPIGLDLKLSGSGKTKIGVAATVQPTYILGDRAYLISTDYKNYVEMPSLTRKWNFSGGFEAYATYNTGKIQWKVGPQVRYQMLSSFKETYPVKEHIFDFGLKVGVMLRNP